ncbi:hypothetical protein BDF19DRAFT_75572 [Syncephalis fuscata]|nr:hypothetical protein BDF19DRAFT_75572 [Syncephalis fuscata]
MAERDLSEPIIADITATIATNRANPARQKQQHQPQQLLVPSTEVASLDLAGQTPSRFLTALNKLDFEPNPFEQSFSQLASPESDPTFLGADTFALSDTTNKRKEDGTLPLTQTNNSSNYGNNSHLSGQRRSSAPNPPANTGDYRNGATTTALLMQRQLNNDSWIISSIRKYTRCTSIQYKDTIDYWN